MTTMLTFSCRKENSILNSTSREEISDLNAKSFQIASTFIMPDENQDHEGTWLQWPHAYQYGLQYRNRLDATWVAMTNALVSSEKVHVIAYNLSEKDRIIKLLNNSNVDLKNVDFSIFQTNDVWVRDNGPIFVKDQLGKTYIEDWGFNGWGYKTSYSKDNIIPSSVSTKLSIDKIDLNNTLILEGGSFEIDGDGTLLATKSAILNSNRNPGKTQSQVETILTQNLGVTNFIWLTGVPNADLTDMHIDGFAKFANKNTIVTMSSSDLTYWEVPSSDIKKLLTSKKKNGTPYNFINLPLTKNNVITSYGKNLGYKGSYVNYYIANTKVLVPFYNDPNDLVAKQVLQSLYPNKTVISIDCRNLYENGGMIHCVTQQQPK